MYSNIVDLVDIYTNYCKRALSSNEIVLISSHYESAARIFKILKDNINSIETYKADGSLVIVDSARAYFDLKNDFVGIMIMLKMLLTRRTKLSKDGIMVISDMGNFFHPLLRTHDLFRHEVEISSAISLPFKFYCSYSTFDLDSFSKNQEQELTQQHNRLINL
jgi:MEDS: MEthanogen/methylotroph, DcmR Sensory domain